jgi:biopolymer transport protein ExbD
MVISVDREGHVFIDETRVTLSDFRVTFRSLVAARKPKGIYLRADRRASYGDVVQVLAVIRGSGLRDVGLVAEEEEVTGP